MLVIRASFAATLYLPPGDERTPRETQDRSHVPKPTTAETSR